MYKVSATSTDLHVKTYSEHWQCEAYCSLPRTVAGPNEHSIRNNVCELFKTINRRDQAHAKYKKSLLDGLKKEEIRTLKCEYYSQQENIRSIYKKNGIYALKGRSYEIGVLESKGLHGWNQLKISIDQAADLGYKFPDSLTFSMASAFMTQNNIRKFFYAAGDYFLSKACFCKAYKEEIQINNDRALSKDYTYLNEAECRAFVANKADAQSRWIKKTNRKYQKKRDMFLEKVSDEQPIYKQIGVLLKKNLLSETGFFDLFQECNGSNLDWEDGFNSFIKRIEMIATKREAINEETLEKLEANVALAKQLDKINRRTEEQKKNERFSSLIHQVSQLKPQRIKEIEDGPDFEDKKQFLKALKIVRSKEVNTAIIKKASQLDADGSIKNASQILADTKRDLLIAKKIEENPETVRILKKECTRINFLIQREKAIEAMKSLEIVYSGII